MLDHRIEIIREEDEDFMKTDQADFVILDDFPELNSESDSGNDTEEAKQEEGFELSNMS